MGVMPSTWNRTKRLWMATVAGIVSFVVGAGLLLLLLAAVAAMAPVIFIWPFVVSLVSFLFGLAACIYAFRVAYIPPRQLWFGYFNLCMCLGQVSVLAFCLYVFAYPIWTAVDERYVIPYGYRGTVVVVYNVMDGEVAQRPDSKTVVYDIPSGGVMHTQDGPIMEATRTSYFYKQADGSLVSIEKEPLDRAVTHEGASVMVFRRAGIGNIDKGNCRLTIGYFYVGTREGFSSRKPEGDLFQMDESSCKLRLRS